MRKASIDVNVKNAHFGFFFFFMFIKEVTSYSAYTQKEITSQTD